jgi:hypothetical protein
VDGVESVQGSAQREAGALVETGLLRRQEVVEVYVEEGEHGRVLETLRMKATGTHEEPELVTGHPSLECDRELDVEVFEAFPIHL